MVEMVRVDIGAVNGAIGVVLGARTGVTECLLVGARVDGVLVGIPDGLVEIGLHATPLPLE